VGIDGKVRDVIAIDGDPQLAQAASEAIRNWNFRPQSDKGQPVEFEAQITITFALTS
jgi:TonB family protein